VQFWCKEANKDLYEHFKRHDDELMRKDSLRELHHQQDTNHVKAFNKLITKFLPKDRIFCQTIESKVSIYSVLGNEHTAHRLPTLLSAPIQTYRDPLKDRVYQTVPPKRRQEKRVAEAEQKEYPCEDCSHEECVYENKRGEKKVSRGQEERIGVQEWNGCTSHLK
jgi:hypothetical protein